MSGVDPVAARAHWDALADSYDEAKARRHVYAEALYGLVGGSVLPDARRVLDVGCGTGQLLGRLRVQAGVGVDASAKMIEQARQRFRQRSELAFKVADATAVGGLGPFDVVVSADLLEHVPDWRAVVAAMVQACAPGGIIVIATPSPKWAAALWVLERLKLKMPEGPHAFVAIRDVARQLAGCGCRVEQMGTHLILPANLGGLGPRLSRWAQRRAGLRHLGVIQRVVARRAAAGATGPTE